MTWVLSATCRVFQGVRGAVVMVRRGRPKDVLVTFQLLCSPHTEGLTVRNAIAIVETARLHKLDPFDLWLIFDGYVCDDLDQAVTKAIEMQAMYDHRRPLTPMDGN